MESVIHQCYFPLHNTPFHLSYASNPSKFNLRFYNSTLHLSQFSNRPPISPSLRHVNCTLDKSSVSPKNEGCNNKFLRGVSGASLALACVIGLFNFSSKINPKLLTAYASISPFIMSHNNATLHVPAQDGEEVVLELLLKIINAERSNENFPWCDHEPNEVEVHALKLRAVSLSKSGKMEEAVKLLKDEYKKCEASEAEFNLGMALVELLMFQENYEEARKQLDHQIDQLLLSYHPNQLNREKKIGTLLNLYKSNNAPEFVKNSITQFLLYKAIIHAMLKNDEATKWWEAFTNIVNE